MLILMQSNICTCYMVYKYSRKTNYVVLNVRKLCIDYRSYSLQTDHEIIIHEILKLSNED